MRKRILALLLLLALPLALTGCGRKSLLSKNAPVSLTFWHVYGEQADSPMNRLVQEFNRTLGAEKGVQVRVTEITSASRIGSYLKGRPRRRYRRAGYARHLHLSHLRRAGAGRG